MSDFCKNLTKCTENTLRIKGTVQQQISTFAVTIAMKNKSSILLIALLSGSTGASLQLSGRNKEGWRLLLISWFVLPAVLWVAITQTSLNISMLRTIFVAAILCIHLSLVFFHWRSGSKEDTQYGSRWSRVALSCAATAVAIFVVSAYVWKGPIVDTSQAQPLYQLSSTELSSAFNHDESAFRKKYDRKIIAVTGTVISQGVDFSEGAYLALEPANGSPADFNCYFLAERQADITNIVPGEIVTVIGVVDGRFLRNCYIQQP
ncbi:MAG TPA: hypothetical protein DHW15_02730 [Bacteroidetes bacterium]|nr:MAG: hypothetical protein ABR95_03200 [Sphingobacteriales bacterium BACL12 MAG-120813-bin55]HCK21100.1 hypothetical protein [Bacteroidota bacterium]